MYFKCRAVYHYPAECKKSLSCFLCRNKFGGNKSCNYVAHSGKCQIFRTVFKEVKKTLYELEKLRLPSVMRSSLKWWNGTLLTWTFFFYWPFAEKTAIEERTKTTVRDDNNFKQKTVKRRRMYLWRKKTERRQKNSKCAKQKKKNSTARVSVDRSSVVCSRSWQVVLLTTRFVYLQYQSYS